MRFARTLVFIGALLAAAPALAQSSLLQAGPVTPGHLPMYSGSGFTQPLVQDSGGSNGCGLAGCGPGANPSELGITSRASHGVSTAPYASNGNGPLGEHFCMFDAPTTNPTGYHYFCMDPNAQGGGLLDYGAAGGATADPLQLILNGTTYQFPFSISGILGPSTTTVGDLAVWNNTTGTLLKDYSGGTGVLAALAQPVTGTGNIVLSNYPTLSGLVASQTAMTPTNLYSICPQGSSSCTGIISSATGNLDYSRGGGLDAYAQTVIYESTHYGTNAYETALDINFNVNTGYCASPFTNCGDRTAIQISTFANAGGGNTWDEAMSTVYGSGWAGAGGNFGVGMEIDPINQATQNTDPVTGGSPFATIIGLWVNMQSGALYGSTDYIQLSNSVIGNGSYGAAVGIFVTGAFNNNEYTFWDNSNAGSGNGANRASYFDSGTHSYGASFSGNYSTAVLTLGGSGTPVSAIADTGNRIYGLNLGGNYSTAAVNIGTQSSAFVAIAVGLNGLVCLDGNSHCIAYISSNNVIHTDTYFNPTALLDVAVLSSALPACVFGSQGLSLSITNGLASPTYNAAVGSGGGTATDKVYCSYNGTSYQWVYQ